MKARPYQTACLQALLHFFATHPDPSDNPCCAMPTGSGKALCIADFMQYVMKTWPGQRIINLVHVKELVAQNAATLKRLWPQAPVGVFSAGLGERTAHMPITFAGTKSMASNLKLFGRQDIIIVDEAHLIPEKEESEYRKVLAYFKALNPHVRVIGFSATPFRMGLGRITEGSIFTHIAYDITGLQAFNDLLDEGYLCPLIPIQTQMIIDVSGVKKVAGEFSAGELERTVNREHLTRAALMETVRAARERNHWLIFASGIEHVDAVAKMLREEFDITCATVHGKMPAAQRDEAILDFKNGKVRALVNANILLTGFDFPALDCLVCLRPTNSVVLHVQALGRGTRPFYAPGFDLETADGRLGAIAASSKQNCIEQGSLVLTDQGLVSIEHVTTAMQVWDGVERVNHDGVICQGEQDVIRYAGLGATGEHKVYTASGWQAFSTCALAKTSICVTGNGRQALRHADGYYRSSGQTWQEQQVSFGSNLRQLQTNIIKRLHKLVSGQCRVPGLPQPAYSSKMALHALLCCAATLSESKRSTLSRLWRSGDQVLLRESFGLREIRNELAQFRKNERIRPRKQQWQLRDWKSKVGYQSTEYEQQEKKRAFVYDILNAGARHRFTVNGLLVSNCLVLDFSGNVQRLGPINDPRVPKRRGEGGGGEIPVKVCGECSCLNHISARVCDNCGANFEIQEKITETASTAELIAKVDSPISERFDVNHVTYESYRSPNPSKPLMLQAHYYCGVQRFSEVVCIEHYGQNVRNLAKHWWKERTGSDQLPGTVAEALALERTIRAPKAVQVWVNRRAPGTRKLQPQITKAYF